MRTIRFFLPAFGFVLVLIVLLFPATGCYYDNLEKLHPELLLNEDCDTTGVISYQNHITTIFIASCGATDNACHNVIGSGGGYVLDNYADVKIAVESGILMNSITWTGGALQMPKGSSAKLGDCQIAKIQKWIDAGSPNN